MTHRRTEIRNALVVALTGLPTTGAHVYASRLRPLTDADLPAILVSTGGEENGGLYLSTGQPLQRELHVTLFICVKATTAFEDTADAILADIEAALFVAPPSLGGVALSVSLASIDDPEMDDSLEKPVCRLPVNLRVVYST